MKNLTNTDGALFYDPKAIDPWFKEKVKNNVFEWSTPESWLYATPEVGSSLTSIAKTLSAAVIGTGVKAIASKVGSKAVPGVGLALAVGETALNAYIIADERNKESYAEVVDAYASKVYGQMANHPEQLAVLLEQGRKELQTKGLKTDDMEDVDVLRSMLVYNAGSGVMGTFDQIKRQAQSGLNELYMSNQALGATDLLEAGLFSYGGALFSKYAKKGLGTVGGKVYDYTIGKSGRADKAVKALTGKAKEFVDKNIDKKINSTVLRFSKDVFGANKKRQALNTVGRIGKKFAAVNYLEATEEGQQHLMTQRYMYTGKLDPKTSYLGSFLENPAIGAQAHLAFWGLSTPEIVDDTNELVQAMKVGGFIGSLLGGTGAALTETSKLATDMRANEKLREMEALTLGAASDDA
ncbi:MAG: hypothetical protein EOM41_08110 [Bacilli bacterium]|nr:hypothetical protein [Bacilli bacterium]